MHCLPYTLIALCCFVTVAHTSAQTLNPANGHYYSLERLEKTWDAARTAAANSSFAGAQGHLVTITSASEQSFVETLVGQLPSKVWLGGFQPTGSTEPAGGWQWVTGEPFVYTNWRFNEPNNLDNFENLLEMFVSEGKWNDVGATQDISLPRFPNLRAYVIEFSVPEPSCPLVLVCCAVMCSRVRRRLSRAPNQRPRAARNANFV